MMRIILDTNILVSALLNPHGKPTGILEIWREGRCEVLMAEAMFGEISLVLNYPKIARRVSLDEIEEYLQFIYSYASFVKEESLEETYACLDPKDNVFLSCALAAGAQFIVSGDAHLLNLKEYCGIPIITVLQFFNIMEQTY